MKLYQVAAKRGLVSYADEVQKLVINELVKRHWNYNLEICGMFETLKERVLNVPCSTRELLELGEFFFSD